MKRKINNISDVTKFQFEILSILHVVVVLSSLSIYKKVEVKFVLEGAMKAQRGVEV
jgi:hypothetical protein